MGSNSKQTEKIRANKVIAQGRERKRALKKGSTPRFPVHLETAPDCVVPQPPQSDPVEKKSLG
ncbi:MAG: hypothetical protein JXR76_30900 [Deltaproteobacteria bacterium]|nr:hypothetical protein [Deltaproteobacteria bacterium]